MAEVFYFHVQEDRSIKYKLPEPIMQEDKDVATWRFRIPKILNEIDMSAWSWWFVYVNARGQKFSELLTLSNDIDDPDNFCTADYSIGYGISKTPGGFTFALESINASQGGEISGEWHTKTYKHKVDSTLQGNQAEYAETEHDIISALIAEYQNLHIGTNQITDGAVTFAKLANDAVTSVKIADSAVTNRKLASNSVSTANVQDGAITEAKVANSAVTTAKLAGSSVTEAKLASDSVSSDKVQDGAITDAKLADALKLKTIKDYVTPEMYGAKGDGVTDDLSAFQSAINAMSSGDVLYIPSGDYFLSDSLTVTKNIHIMGDGALSVTHQKPVLILDTLTSVIIDINTIKKDSRVFDYVEGAKNYSIAVLMENCDGCNVTVHNIAYTTTAFVLMSSDNKGCHYNTIRCDKAQTFAGIEIVRSSTGGWVNGNEVLNFRWMVNTWSDNTDLIPAYMIKSVSYAKSGEAEPYKNNGNVFDHLSAEYGAKAADYPILLCRLDYANGYTLTFDRVEISPKVSTLSENTFYFTNSTKCTATIWYNNSNSVSASVGNSATDHNVIYSKTDYENLVYSGVKSIISDVTIDASITYTQYWFNIVKIHAVRKVRIFGELEVTADIANGTHIISNLPASRLGLNTMKIVMGTTATLWNAPTNVTFYKLSIGGGGTAISNRGTIPAGTHLFIDFEYFANDSEF